MGGVIGAVSSKFVFAAAGLLIASRVDHEPVRAWIDPASPISAVSESLAAKLGTINPDTDSVVRHKHPMTIGIGGEEYDVDLLHVTSLTPPDDATLVLGRDMLNAHMIDLDFRSRCIRLLLKSEYKHETRRMTEVVLTSDSHGRWIIPAAVVGHPQIPAVLDLSNPHAVTLSVIKSPASIMITIGGATINETDISSSGASTEPMIIGLRAFLNKHIIIDLPHSRLWIEK